MQHLANVQFLSSIGHELCLPQVLLVSIKENELIYFNVQQVWSTYGLNFEVCFMFFFIGFKAFKRFQKTRVRLIEMRIRQVYRSVLNKKINVCLVYKQYTMYSKVHAVITKYKGSTFTPLSTQINLSNDYIQCLKKTVICHAKQVLMSLNKKNNIYLLTINFTKAGCQ